MQYLTVNLKVFAYCSELLHKHFRSLQNDSKSPPRGLLDPLGEAMGAPWRSKMPPKDPQEAPKVTKNPGKWSPRDHQGVPKRSHDVLEALQVIPKRSLRNPQGVHKGFPGVPRGPQEVPKGSLGVTGRLRSRWNDGVAPKSAALRRRVRPVKISYTCNVYVQGGQNEVVRGSSGVRQGVARGSPPQKSTTEAQKVLPWSSFWSSLTPILQPRCRFSTTYSSIFCFSTEVN